ncbi:hypothetical protein ACFQYP_33795 [Nonomuraea antimicrobica]
MAVPAGKLINGWQIRWRARATTTSGMSGPWSAWVPARVDTKVSNTIPPAPVVGKISAPGQLVSGVWILPSAGPVFTAAISDADRRPGVLEAEVEHDPAATGQGSGLIWSGQGKTFGETCFTGQTCSASHQTPAVAGAQNGWLIRWRVRAVVQSTESPGALVAGAWSEWQAGRVDTSKPVVSGLAASPVRRPQDCGRCRRCSRRSPRMGLIRSRGRCVWRRRSSMIRRLRAKDPG